MQMIRPKEQIPVRISKIPDQSEEDVDQEIESPKSVVAAASQSGGGRWRKNSGECFHIQVMRLKEEESHLGEDIYEGINADYKKNFACVADEGIGFYRRSSGSPDEDVLKPMSLPASPLSGAMTPRREVRN